MKIPISTIDSLLLAERFTRAWLDEKNYDVSYCRPGLHGINEHVVITGTGRRGDLVSLSFGLSPAFCWAVNHVRMGLRLHCYELDSDPMHGFSAIANKTDRESWLCRLRACSFTPYFSELRAKNRALISDMQRYRELAERYLRLLPEFGNLSEAHRAVIAQVSGIQLRKGFIIPASAWAAYDIAGALLWLHSHDLEGRVDRFQTEAIESLELAWRCRLMADEVMRQYGEWPNAWRRTASSR